MYSRILVACAAIIPTIFMSMAASAEPIASRNCWHANEYSAAQVHNFQIMLMVGSLKCRDYLPNATEGYNVFMNSQKDLVMANQYVVRAHFIREHGTVSGSAAFNDYETSLANLHSYGNSVKTCESIGAYSRLAANASEADLQTLIRVAAINSLVTACPADQQDLVKANTPAPELAVASLPDNAVAETAVAPVPVMAEATGGPATAPTDSALATKPEPAPVAAPAAPTAAQALQEAAKALALAATALQAQSAAPVKVAEASVSDAN